MVCLRPFGRQSRAALPVPTTTPKLVSLFSLSICPRLSSSDAKDWEVDTLAGAPKQRLVVATTSAQLQPNATYVRSPLMPSVETGLVLPSRRPARNDDSGELGSEMGAGMPTHLAPRSFVRAAGPKMKATIVEGHWSYLIVDHDSSIHSPDIDIVVYRCHSRLTRRCGSELQ